MEGGHALQLGDSTATAAAIRAAENLRQQQGSWGRGSLYAPDAQSVAAKVQLYFRV